jgi:hypothetical protein
MLPYPLHEGTPCLFQWWGLTGRLLTADVLAATEPAPPPPPPLTGSCYQQVAKLGAYDAYHITSCHTTSQLLHGMITLSLCRALCVM